MKDDAQLVLTSILKTFIVKPELVNITVFYSLSQVILDEVTTINKPLNLADRYNTNSLDSLTPFILKYKTLIHLEKQEPWERYLAIYWHINKKLSKYMYIKVRMEIFTTLTPIYCNIERTLLEVEADNVKR